MAGGSQSVGGSLAGQLQQLVQQNQGSPTYGPSNYASPNQNFMQYPQQGQINQPQNASISPMTAQPPTTSLIGGPDMTGNSPASNMGFDGSGSDAGVGGHPVNQMQSPVQWQGNKPPSMSNFQPSKGLQIQGNPTSQVVQRPQR